METTNARTIVVPVPYAWLLGAMPEIALEVVLTADFVWVALKVALEVVLATQVVLIPLQAVPLVFDPVDVVLEPLEALELCV